MKSPTVNNPSYDRSVHKHLPGFISLDSCTKKFRDEFQIGGVYFTGYRYMIHFYCLAVEAGFYSEVVECLPVDPATWVPFPAGTGETFSLYDRGKQPAMLSSH